MRPAERRLKNPSADRPAELDAGVAQYFPRLPDALYRRQHSLRQRVLSDVVPRVGLPRHSRS